MKVGGVEFSSRNALSKRILAILQKYQPGLNVTDPEDIAILHDVWKNADHSGGEAPWTPIYFTVTYTQRSSARTIYALSPNGRTGFFGESGLMAAVNLTIPVRQKPEKDEEDDEIEDVVEGLKKGRARREMDEDD